MIITRRKSDNIVTHAGENLRLQDTGLMANGSWNPTVNTVTCDALEVDSIPDNWKGGKFSYTKTDGWQLADQNWETEQLKQAKAEKCAEINAKRDKQQSKPLAYTFPDGKTGHIQRRNQKDERNIQGVASAAMALVVTGNTEGRVHFTDRENVKHEMTGSEGMAFGLFVQKNYADNQNNARKLKDAVNALTTINDVKKSKSSGGWA